MDVKNYRIWLFHPKFIGYWKDIVRVAGFATIGLTSVLQGSLDILSVVCGSFLILFGSILAVAESELEQK